MLYNKSSKTGAPGTLQQLLPPAQGTQPKEGPVHPQNDHRICVGPRQTAGREAHRVGSRLLTKWREAEAGPGGGGRGSHLGKRS